MDIDQEAVKNYLSKNLGLDPEGKIIVKQFEHGQSNPTYLIEYLGSKNEAALLRDQPFLWVYYTVYYMNTKSKKVAIF